MMEMEKKLQLKLSQTWRQIKHFTLIPVDAISSKGYAALALFNFSPSKALLLPFSLTDLSRNNCSSDSYAILNVKGLRLAVGTMDN
jgi:hypothetical protein